MRIRYVFSLFLVVFWGINLYAEKDKWTVVDIVDQFGDTTGKKRLVYQTTGTFSNSAARNSQLDVMVLVDRPGLIDVIVFEYGKYKVSLNDGVFSYKIGDKKIENVPLRGNLVFLDAFTLLRDESTSLLYLLKQGGLVQFSVYRKSSSYYRFDVNADNFITLLSETFTNDRLYLEYAYLIQDVKEKKISVCFMLGFNWTIERENLLKNNSDIQRIVTEFFQDKDYNFAFDRPGGYYQREKVKQNWELPLLEKIKALFPDFGLEFSSFTVN